MSRLSKINWIKISLNAAYVGGITFFAMWSSGSAATALKPAAIAIGTAGLAALALEMRRLGLWNDEPPKSSRLSNAALLL